MTKEKTQIFFIHGGMTFKNRNDYLIYLKTREVSVEERVRWSDEYLKRRLGKYFQIIKPRMPLQDNANYDEWKICFERYFPQLRDNIILVGSSLGGIFLAKYLSENKFSKKILSLYLIGPPFYNNLPNEDLVGGFKLKSDLSKIEKNSKNIHLLFAKNDDVVPVSHAKMYKDKLKTANIMIYKHIEGHFKCSKLPEIIRMIKNDLKRI